MKTLKIRTKNRSQEKSIEQAIKTVTVWRQLSTGILEPIFDENGKETGDVQYKRWTQRDAAEKMDENYTTL